MFRRVCSLLIAQSKPSQAPILALNSCKPRLTSDIPFCSQGWGGLSTAELLAQSSSRKTTRKLDGVL